MRNFQLEVSHRYTHFKEPKKVIQEPKIEMISGHLPLVKDRAEWNQQTFIIRPEYEKKMQTSIDNQLNCEFPIHRDFDFVTSHSLGFKGKENVDLFKFYYRLYLKNKFTIQKIRKEKKTKETIQQQKQQQQSNQTEEPNTDELRRVLAVTEIKPPSSKKQLKFVRNCLKELNQQAQIINKHIQFPKIIPEVSVINLNSEIIPQAKAKDQNLNLEQILLNRVIQAISESQFISHKEVQQVKEIILKRQQQLSEIERELQVQEIIQIKKQIYERQLKQNQIQQYQPPGIDNPEYFQEISSIQEQSQIRSTHHKSQPSISVVEYRFHNYENEPQEFKKIKVTQQKNDEETLVEQSTEMQSILQQIRSTSLVTKNIEQEEQKEKLFPPLKFLEQAKQQIGQKSEQSQPYITSDIEENNSSSNHNKQNIQKSIALIQNLQSTSLLKSNEIKSNSKTELSQQQQKTQNQKSESKRDQKINEVQKKNDINTSIIPDDKSEEMKFIAENYYEMKFSQILQKVKDKKKSQLGEESQTNQSLSKVESEVVQKLTQNFVANIIKSIQNNSQNYFNTISSQTYNYLDVDLDEQQQQQVTQSIPEIGQVQNDEEKRHLSYNRDISHLDHTFKIDSQVSVGDKHLSEEQIANIIQQIAQQLQQAKLPAEQIQKHLDEITASLIKQPLNKLQAQINKPEQIKIVYHQDQSNQQQIPKSIRQKEQIDYLKFYEDNAPTKKEKSKHSMKINQNSSKRSQKSFQNLTEEERKQFLDSHKINLQERANEKEIDQELEFLQQVIGDQKKQREQIFKQRVSQEPIISGKNTSRDGDFEENEQQATFRSHNPPLNSIQENDSIKQQQTDINFNIRKSQQIKPTQKSKHFEKKDKTINQQEYQYVASSRSNGQPSFGQSIGQTKRQNENEEQFEENSYKTKSINKQQNLLNKQKQQQSEEQDGSQNENNLEESQEQIQNENYDENEDSDQNEDIRVVQQIDENGNIVILTQRTDKKSTSKTKQSQKQSDKGSQKISNKIPSSVKSQNQNNIKDIDEHKQINNQIENNQIQQEIQQKNKTENQFYQNNQTKQDDQPTLKPYQSQKELPLSKNENDKLELKKVESQIIMSNQGTINESINGISPQQINLRTRTTTNLNEIQLQSYTPTLNNTPSQNNTPLLLQQSQSQGRKGLGKSTKFEEPKGSKDNTPQGRFQRVKTKLSKFQEAQNNDDDYDYDDIDDEEDQNGKKKKTSKSSKSTLREQQQNSPAKQTIVAKKKIYDLKQEYDLIAKQNLTLADLKKDIEKKIQLLQNPDDEAKYNIYLFEQRQKQLKNLPSSIEGNINNKREVEDQCGDIIRKFHENRMRYKDVIDKDQALKFTNQIHLDDEQQTQINTQSHLDEYMREVQMNIQRMIQQVQIEQMRDHPEQRKECFDYDSNIIQERRLQSLQSDIKQDQAQMKIYEEQSQIVQQQQNIIKQEQEIINEVDKKVAQFAQKLRILKLNNPIKFNEVVTTEIQKDQLYLQTTKHKYILE